MVRAAVAGEDQARFVRDHQCVGDADRRAPGMRIWHAFGLQPWRTQTFKVSPDPFLIDKVRDAVGLYLAPPRTSSGHRDDPPAGEARPAFIRDAQHAGLTLAEIRGILALRDSGEAPCGHVTDLIHQHLEEISRRMADLRKTHTVLRDLAQQAAETDPQSCSDADNICRIISPPTGRTLNPGMATFPSAGSVGAERM